MNKNIIICSILFALVNLILGKFDLFVGLFFLTLIFIPILYLSFRSNSLAINTFILTIFFSLYLSFLLFYINFSDYNQFINFSFNELDQLKLFIKIGLISLSFVIFSIFLKKILILLNLDFFKSFLPLVSPGISL